MLKYSLAFFIQQVEQCGGLLADQVDAASIVNIIDVHPADALCSVLLLHETKEKQPSMISDLLIWFWVTVFRSYWKYHAYLI